jgi:hypothetical protein
MLHKYEPMVNKTTEVMTSTDIGPQGILNFIESRLMLDENFDIKVSDSEYKLKVVGKNN